MKEKFTHIYTHRKWGGMSGKGSTVEFNTLYFEFMSNFLRDHNIKSVVDLGCGDFVVSKKIFFNTNIDYTGIDCVDFIACLLEKLYRESNNIHFLCYDIFSNKENIPTADLFLLKDVLQHWMNQYIYDFLDYMIPTHKNSIFMVVNSCHQQNDNDDIRNNGQWRQLSASFLPLRKYHPEVIFNYNDKEVSIIKFNDTEDYTSNMEKS